jgi:putative heme-binding domain-containing protein
MTRLGWVAVLAALGHLTLAPAQMRQQTQVPAAESQVRGDAAHGEAIVEAKGGCLACHRVADHGSHLGPDLSAIGNSRSVAQLQKAMLDPGPEASAGFLYKVTTKAGKSYSGRLMNQDRTSIQLLDSDDRLRGFLKDDLASYGFAPTAPMPSYRDKLTPAEQDDVMAYLASLRGIVRQ